MKGKFLGIIAVLTILFSLGFNDAQAQRYDGRHKPHRSEYQHKKKRHHHPKYVRPGRPHHVRGHHMSLRERRAVERHHKMAIREHKRALKHSKNIRKAHTYGFGSTHH